MLAVALFNYHPRLCVIGYRRDSPVAVAIRGGYSAIIRVLAPYVTLDEPRMPLPQGPVPTFEIAREQSDGAYAMEATRRRIAEWEADVGWTRPILMALRVRQWGIARLLVECGAKPDLLWQQPYPHQCNDMALRFILESRVRAILRSADRRGRPVTAATGGAVRPATALNKWYESSMYERHLIDTVLSFVFVPLPTPDAFREYTAFFASNPRPLTTHERIVAFPIDATPRPP